ncbi:hypothetical protein CC1G_02501 [Coprinopsis cinerea okayama7|uniref:Uncharacterized protein n=1 Tax=Coprinopsis cinerea (strain Okayama-7 / 130 / ATCC MYA-4618 / FGSC 9003) TaxID=240176 RepID=A8NBP1_COPC7|nr:hypothetical protein CC1G_02501 [Coprinopsis cinerea okayama7\|eukprot:XP_001832239.2 hypothetical protein CC1G_02501 [Coprinopsis cinerea okayama7\
MAILYSHHPTMPPRKRMRRTATSVMAGDFDVPPPRDVLTSLLNGVGPYKVVERDAEEKKQRRKERKERKEKKKARALELAAAESSATIRGSTTNATSITVPPPINSRASSFWKSKASSVPKARPEIMIASTQRSVSVTPPPMPSPQPTPDCTPGPSVSSSMSHDSLKRLHTPDDDEDLDGRHIPAPAPPPKKERRKRPAARKGWKGWVEGSPPPSEKLINLDAVPILQERRTRSGKNFDAIGVGKDGWV